MYRKSKIAYERPCMEPMTLEYVQMLAVSSSSVGVGGWGDGGSLGGGDAEEESRSRRGTWGNLWATDK